MSLLLAGGERDGCAWYRVEVPARWLQRQGVEVRTAYAAQGDLTDQDLVVVQTFSSSRGIDPTLVYATAIMQQRGIRVAYDVDDDLWAIPDWNPLKALWTGSMYKNLTSMIRLADVVTTTTEQLGATLELLNHRVQVIPNALPREAFSDCDRSAHTGIRVGWAGSATHDKDLEQVHAALAQLLLDRPDVTLVFMGWCPPVWADYRARVESRPWVQPPMYYRELESLDLDVFIAPLADCAFNRSKSDVKLLEAAAMGWPIVCTDFGPYAGGPDVVPGIRVPLDRPDRWVEALTTLIRDAELRRMFGLDAWRHVSKHRTIDDTGPRWLRAFGVTA